MPEVAEAAGRDPGRGPSTDSGRVNAFGMIKLAHEGQKAGTDAPLGAQDA
jgi:hypothetical protein